MPAAPLIVAILLAVTVALGATGLALDPAPFSPSASVLFLAATAVLTVVAAAGVLLARGRWSRAVTAALGANWIAAGLVLESGWGLVVTVGGAAMLAAAIGPWLPRWLRHLPSAEGPPPTAVVMLLALLATPVAMAWAVITDVPAVAWAFSGWCVVLAFAIARAISGSLVAARFAHPAVAIAVVVSLDDLAAAIATLALATVVTVLAWRREVALALVPAMPGRDVVRIPPELAPPEVLEAAGLDDTGRPRSL